MERTTVAILAFLVLHIVLAIYLANMFGDRYVSDEVWYVSASRNLLNDLGIVPQNTNCASIPVKVMNRTVVDVRSLLYLARQLHVSVSFYGENTSIARLCSDDLNKILFIAYTLRTPIRFGYRYPSHKGADILFYYNWEHPPLYKLMMLPILAFADEPRAWRLLSVVFSAIAMLATLIVARAIYGFYGVLVAGTVLLLDPAFRTMSSIAMLDITASTSLALCLLFALRRNAIGAGIGLGIGVASKWTSAFNVIPLLILMGLRNTVKAVVIASIIYLCSYAIPLMMYGLDVLTKETVKAMMWHTMAKCIGPHCPPYSSPFDWFYANNLFPVYVDQIKVVFVDFPFFIAIPCLVVSIALFLVGIRHQMIAVIVASILGPWSGYLLLYLLGDVTQYSYYTVHLSSGIAIGFTAFVKLVSEIDRVEIWLAIRRFLKRGAWT